MIHPFQMGVSMTSHSQSDSFSQTNFVSWLFLYKLLSNILTAWKYGDKWCLVHVPAQQLTSSSDSSNVQKTLYKHFRFKEAGIIKWKDIIFEGFILVVQFKILCLCEDNKRSYIKFYITHISITKITFKTLIFRIYQELMNSQQH